MNRLLGSSLFLPALGHSRRCPEEYGPVETELQPAGWLIDFDYKRNPAEYFREHYEAAKKDELNLYAFFFSDWCKPCRSIRLKIEKHESLRATLEETRILMIDVTSFNCLVDELSDGQLRVPIEFVPILAKVNSDGSLGEAITPTNWLEKPLRSTISGLRRYLEATAEF